MWHGSTWEWDGPSANHNTIEQNRARKTTCKSTNSRQWAGMDGVGDGEWGGAVVGRARAPSTYHNGRAGTCPCTEDSCTDPDSSTGGDTGHMQGSSQPAGSASVEGRTRMRRPACLQFLQKQIAVG